MNNKSPDINEYTFCYYVLYTLFTMHDNIEVEKDEFKELPTFS